MIANRYIAMVDILGFKELIRQKTLIDVVKMIEQLLESTNIEIDYNRTYPHTGTIISGTFIAKKLHFSDTLVFWTPPFDCSTPDERELITRAFFSSLAWVIFHGMISEIPLRAGVAFGESYIDEEERIILGQAIVDAHITESAQDWIGGALHPSCPVSQIRESSVPIIDYAVPVKDHINLTLRYAIDWTGGAAKTNHREALEEAFKTYLEYDLSESVKNKYLNAKAFYDLQRRRAKMSCIEPGMHKLLIAVREHGAAEKLEGFLLFDIKGGPSWPIPEQVFENAVRLKYVTFEPYTSGTLDQSKDMLTVKLTEEGKRLLDP